MKMSATEILLLNEPGELFSDNPAAIKNEYSQLAKIWHPDFNGNSKESNEVMAKINSLYNQALALIQSGTWQKSGLIRLHSKDGKVHEITYQVLMPFELGLMYIGNTVVFYLIEEEYQDFFHNAQEMINNFTFANEAMKAEVSRYLPKIISQFETNNNQFGIVIEKTPDLLLLKDVLTFFDSKLSERHTAWILSSLLNLACYLDYCGISHNAITLDTYFISPKNHSGALLGGWWYAVPQGDKLKGVPDKIFSIMPPQIKDRKSGSILTDLESIRLIGRELLGDRTGARLEESRAAPPAMVHWLRGAAPDTAYEDYSQWDTTLKESFGAKRFVQMDITGEILYSKEKAVK